MKVKNKQRAAKACKKSRDPDAFQPSRAFTKYLMLVQAIQSEPESAFVDDLIAKREMITKKITERESTSLNEAYEKLYIWRAECFEPTEEGDICFEDRFPLSVYYDLKKFTGDGELSTELDRDIEIRLRRPEEYKRKQLARERQNAELITAADPNKLH